MSKLNQNYADLLRPKKLKDIKNQPLATQLVTNMVRSGEWLNRLLITGNTGTGKTSLAFIIARLFLCNNPDKVNIEPCGTCSNCKLWSSDNPPSHPKLVFIEATTQGGKEDAEIITDVMYSAGGKRVLLIDECAELTKSAQTLLQVPLETVMLKNSNLILIACTAYPQNLKIDFRHRFTPINFSNTSITELVNLGESVLSNLAIDYEVEALESLARHSEKSFRGFLTTLEAIIKALPNGEPLTEKIVASYLNILTSRNRSKLWEKVRTGKFSTKDIEILTARGLDVDKLMKDLLKDLTQVNLNENTAIEYKLFRDVMMADSKFRWDALMYILLTLSNEYKKRLEQSI